MAEEAAGTQGGGTEGASSGEGSGASSAEKTFTQSELNAIVQDRLARATKGQLSKDELKVLTDAKAELDKIKSDGASELEKAQAAAAAAEAKATNAVAAANERLLKASAIAELAKAGVENVEAAYRALDKTGLSIADDGAVAGVEEAVKSLVAEIPGLVGKGSSGSADQGARGGGPDKITREQLKSMAPHEVTKALKAGKLDHLTGGGA